MCQRRFSVRLTLCLKSARALSAPAPFAICCCDTPAGGDQVKPRVVGCVAPRRTGLVRGVSATQAAPRCALGQEPPPAPLRTRSAAVPVVNSLHGDRRARIAIIDLQHSRDVRSSRHMSRVIVDACRSFRYQRGEKFCTLQIADSNLLFAAVVLSGVQHTFRNHAGALGCWRKIFGCYWQQQPTGCIVCIGSTGFWC